MTSTDSPADSTRTTLTRIAGELRSRLDEQLSDAAALRRRIHSDPRISGMEYDTRDILVSELAGILQFDEVASAGAIGRIGPDGPAVGIRAELDALPVHESTGVEFAASNGAMHACGHDVHQAALVALIRAAAQVDLPVAIGAVLQPREETYPSGALDIVEEKALEKINVTHMIAAHVHPGVLAGTIAVGAGYINAAADEINIVLRGRGGHGAYPHTAADPVTAIAQLAIGLPEAVRRTVDPMSPALLSVGTLRAGDSAANVLPSEAYLRATMRTTSNEQRIDLFEAVRQMAEGTAAAYGLSADISRDSGEPVLTNHKELAEGAEAWLGAMGHDIAEPMRSLGADDFSYFCSVMPSLMTFVGVEVEGCSPAPSLHDPRFLPTERAIKDVAHAMLAGYLAGAERILNEQVDEEINR
ncbi:amidohydrolase [Helcobacillus sp. ACRRO]|uniref:M20 metallopeptidase family protein n=1 Tax=Helcobacillus sp. ACRRO TaxID=2918202 RepID=UPI001EF73A6F|nr:amidohydrolase [Helcobacillus sp. ACRRO]MCG7426694.1 amidohydrolase [Helcobacillus sp. ACRRO]